MKVMKTLTYLTIIIAGLLSAIGLSAHAQGTAFSYQGRLNDGASPATGIYDLRFTVCDAVTNGSLVAGPLTNSATGVTNGLFAVTLDFSNGVFTGPARWLEIAARTNGAASFITLSPRQPVLPTPYAVMANSASNLLGNVPSAQLSGTVALTQLPGAVVTNNAIGLVLNGTFNGNAGGINNTNQAGANYSFLGGGQNNSIEPYATNSFLGGGDNNSIQMYSTASFLGGGENNSMQAGDYGSVLVGGQINNIQTNAYNSFLGGGNFNSIQSYAAHAVLVGGYANSIQLNIRNAFLGGGRYNTNGSSYGVISGGYNNLVTNNCATVPGGSNNVAGGQCSFAAGQYAQAVNDNAFVWSDGSGTLASTNNQSVNMLASGGYRLFSGPSSGVYLAAGGGSWTSLSDRNAKENFVPVDAGLVLEKVAALPLSVWNYKSQDAAIRHIGPMAQDFKATFAVGESDTGITTVDESGVALAAIQGLNQKLNEKDAEIEALKQSMAELKEMVQTLAAKK